MGKNQNLSFLFLFIIIQNPGLTVVPLSYNRHKLLIVYIIYVAYPFFHPMITRPMYEVWNRRPNGMADLSDNRYKADETWEESSIRSFWCFCRNTEITKHSLRGVINAVNVALYWSRNYIIQASGLLCYHFHLIQYSYSASLWNTGLREYCIFLKPVSFIWNKIRGSLLTMFSERTLVFLIKSGRLIGSPANFIRNIIRKPYLPGLGIIPFEIFAFPAVVSCIKIDCAAFLSYTLLFAASIISFS